MTWNITEIDGVQYFVFNAEFAVPCGDYPSSGMVVTVPAAQDWNWDTSYCAQTWEFASE